MSQHSWHIEVHNILNSRFWLTTRPYKSTKKVLTVFVLSSLPGPSSSREAYHITLFHYIYIYIRKFKNNQYHLISLVAAMQSWKHVNSFKIEVRNVQRKRRICQQATCADKYKTSSCGPLMNMTQEDNGQYPAKSLVGLHWHRLCSSSCAKRDRTTAIAANF